MKQITTSGTSKTNEERIRFILDQISKNSLSTDRSYVIAIDGMAAAGKSTLAADLATILNADLIHMDDFFLPPELRTEERLNTPGGNVHYERFQAEVLPYLSTAQAFSYRIFDCSRMELHGEQKLTAKSYRIVEGSYSCHPIFGDYADLTIFLQIDPEEQMHRIRQRNGNEKAEMFRTRWIPLENAYFDAYSTSRKANLIL